MLKEFFNSRAHIWDETVAEKDIARLERMAERLDLKPGSVVLDVGTGTGVFLPFILGKVGINGRVVALDIADAMLQKAWEKGFNGNIDYLQADIGGIPLLGEIFDSVICYSSFPHFRDKLIAFNEIYRVMKAGGRLHICHTSSRAAINEVHASIPEVENDILPDAAEMERLLSEAGFSGIKVEDYSSYYLASAAKPF
ncbi:class I SAM-dependent methyltransferase [Chloroflexota bacterium]